MMHRPVLNFFQVASLVMLLVVVALLAAVITMHFVIHGAEVAIPSLKGMTVADARSQTSGLGLDLDVDNRYYSGDVAAGHILTQSPAPGTVVRREWRVRVAESLGAQKVDVPDTVGSAERVAALRLRASGLEVGTTARLPFSKVTPETVIAQDPPARAQGIERPSISLLVATADDADDPDGFVMPDLTGLSVISAQAQLAKVGIKTALPKLVDVPIAPVGSGNAAPRPMVMPGVVTAQQPLAGTRVDQSTVVKLTAAK
jgi:beta-lactam-binding protein with PASTA domain